MAQVREALDAGAVPAARHMPLASLGRRWRWRVVRRRRAQASGGLTLGCAREVAETGVDYLAVGALTHSSRALDLGLDFADGS